MSDHTYDMVMSEAMLREFYDLEKQAISTARLGNLIGAGVGAIGGGLAGRAATPEDQKGSGMLRGALLGAGVGALGGQAATQAGRREVLQFGQRQLHGATGYLPGRGLIGRGPEGTKWHQLGEKGTKITGSQRRQALRDIGFKFSPGKTKERMQELAQKKLSKGKITGMLPESVQKFFANRQAASEFAKKQIAEEGMTSIPGLVRGYTRGGASGTLTPWQAAKANLMAPGLAMGVGVPALMSVGSVNEYRQTGDKQRLAEDLASNVGFGLGGALPLTAMTALGSSVGGAGKLIGRGVEAVQGAPVSPAAQQAVGQVVPR